MRLLVLGGTLFLGSHVATAAQARGHDVATFTRGVTGSPPDGVRDLHGDRDDPDALPKALDGWQPEVVVDTSCQTRAAARNAAAVLDGVRGYAFVSSLNAYAGWPPGPIGREDDEAAWTTDDDEYGPIKAFAEREIGAAVGESFLTARAGLILGPLDPIYRLGYWLDRIARGGRVVVPAEGLAQPMAVVDARDLAAWLVEMAERGQGGAVNATGPNGMTTLGDLLEHLPRGHRRRRGVRARGGGDPGRGRRRAVAAPAVLAAGRHSADGVGRRHHPRPRTGTAQPAAAGDGRRHLGLAADRRADVPVTVRTAAPRPAGGPGVPPARMMMIR